ncbi:MAG: hypothetical protein Q8Q02_11810 [Nocardioides sp.]|nr:hypothetical protein [Nocardioides sp.]
MSAPSLPARPALAHLCVLVLSSALVAGCTSAPPEEAGGGAGVASAGEAPTVSLVGGPGEGGLARRGVPVARWQAVERLAPGTA